MTECKSCKFADDLMGCASHHVDTARKLLSEGKTEEADDSLKGIQQHLKE
ncbi:hypothetical protein ACFL0D_05295 [Thermoproteota archaeon]